MAVPTNVPVNTSVSVHVTDPVPFGVGLVAELDDEKARFVAVPVIGRVTFSGVLPCSAPQLAGGITEVSASVPVITPVPVRFDLEDGCVSVILTVPFNVRVEMQTLAPVVVVTII